MNMNEVLANRALELIGEEKGNYKVISPNTHVNMSQSTNDIFPSSINLALIIKIDYILEVLDKLKDTLLHKSQELKPIFRMGRTHLNAAEPISIGQYFNACTTQLIRDIRKILQVKEFLKYIPLGGTIIGVGSKASKRYRKCATKNLRAISGINIKACPDLIDGIQSVGNYNTLSSFLKECAINLSKMASDLRLMGSESKYGFGDIVLPSRQIGSSFMPEKVNPVIPELINQISFIVCGYDLSISMAAQAGQLELNVFKPVISHCLFKMLDIMTESISLFNKFCLTGIEAKVRKL